MHIDQQTYGLALGGGAALGIAHIGVLQHLQERQIKISHYTGTSVGSIVAAALAKGIPIDELMEFARSVGWRHFTALRLPRQGFLSSNVFQNKIKELIGDCSFEDLEVPLAVVATDILTGKRIVLNQGKILPAVAASCALPGVFEPVRLGKYLLSDGGLKENVPIITAKELGAERVIAVDLISNKLPTTEPTNLFDVLIRAINIFQIQFDHNIMDSDILIAPDLRNFTGLDIHRVDDLVEAGYVATKCALETFDQKENVI
ncbi:MAG: patatin-like phospholipase family protein [Halanaerobiales bacterium]|nr:patatin-like phospholipase family protein [Halanaerobiales bacterium]